MSRGADAVKCDPRHGWLPALLPAAAVRFRVDDPGLAAALADSGAELVERSPDVEIVQADEVRGDARRAVVSLGTPEAEDAGRLARAAQRVVGSLAVRAQAARARRGLRRRGYPTVFSLTWDPEKQQTLHLPWLSVPRPSGKGARHGVVRRFPLAALVVGSREREASVLEAALDAARGTGLVLESGWPLVGWSGVMLQIGDAGVLRVAVGPARRAIERQRRALEALEAAGAPPLVAERAPSPLGRGELGLASWSVEQRLVGASPPLALGDRLVADCLDFLVALHRAGDGRRGGRSPAEDADAIAQACKPNEARALRQLGRRVADELGQVPRGFGHGDFWGKNLLVEGDTLAGVVDWTRAGGGRLPLLDLLHLFLNIEWARRGGHLGEAFAEYLLPWARAGGDELSREYCRRIDLELTRTRLEALTAAYWLDLVADDLRTYADRPLRPGWMEKNVHLVVRALVAGGLAAAP